ncbi:MAG: glycosyltransferase, partial [Syntrophothermus sp.]
MKNDPDDSFRELVPLYDIILTYGGGDPVINEYMNFGARQCVPIYNALDPATHFPVFPEDKFKCRLSLLANRMPDREERVWEFFLNPAASMPEYNFILGGNGWQYNTPDIPNVSFKGHVYTDEHNAFNSSPLAVLNISRDSMAKYGFSPATRVFEAAGAGACIITDWWEGIDYFLEPGKEILVARNGGEVTEIVKELTPSRAKEIGKAAMARVLKEHTYAHRALLMENLLYALIESTGVSKL